MQTCQIIVYGKVQGVYYRESTKQQALSLGITGNVTNLDDGSVLINATGEEDAIQALLSWCKQGPPRAAVSNIVMTPLEFQTFDDFIVKRSP